MERFPSHPAEEPENAVKDAAENAGLHEIEMPRVGTKAYQSLVDIAQKYVETIKMIEGFRTRKAQKGTQDTNIGTLEQERKKLHDQLCIKLEGRHEDELDLEEQQKITNFAAYLTGMEEYVIRPHPQSQVSYFRDLGRE